MPQTSRNILSLSEKQIDKELENIFKRAKPATIHNRWTEKEIYILKKCYRKITIPEIQKILKNRTVNAIKWQIYYLKSKNQL